MDAYRAWVADVVERYDGDGKDDAPGLPRGIHQWEVDNEPDLHHTRPPGKGQKMPAEFATPAEYARVAIATAAAVHEADPGALVLPAGLFSPDEEKMGAYARELWAIPEFAAAFPQANTHSYRGRPEDRPWRDVAVIAGLAPGRPIWVTETSTSSEPPRDQAAQAIDLVTMFVEALRRGTPRLYWHSLNEKPPGRGRDTSFDFNHLLGPPPTRTPKQAAQALTWMLDQWGEIPRSDVRDITGKDGVSAIAIGDARVYWSADRAIARADLGDGDREIGPLATAHQGLTRRRVSGRTEIDLSSGPVVVLSPR
jgi:hypothetical protein